MKKLAVYDADSENELTDSIDKSRSASGEGVKRVLPNRRCKKGEIIIKWAKINGRPSLGHTFAGEAQCFV